MNNQLNFKKILVIGAGSWGTTLSKILTYNINDVILYTRDRSLAAEINYSHINDKKLSNIILPNNVKVVNNYIDIQDINTVVIASPVKALDLVCRNLKKSKHINNIVICSKGIDNGSLNFPSQICEKYFMNANIAVLSGPNFAKEIALKKVAKTLIASKNKTFAIYLQNIFKTEYFYPEISDDVIGVEVCGAIKNVIAIATGIAKGLDLGENFISSLLVLALKEISIAVNAFDADQATVYSLAGLGDLLLTAYSLTSRNTSFGYNLAKNKWPIDLSIVTVEGYYTAKSIFNIAKKLGINMPICDYVYDILYSNMNLQQIEKIIQ